MRKLGVVVALLAVAGLLVFLGSLFIAPPLPPALAVMKKEIRAIQERQPEGQVAQVPLWRRYLESKKTKASGKTDVVPRISRPGRQPSEIRLGHYVSWDPESFESLKHHAHQLTHVATQSLVMPDVEGGLVVRLDEKIEEYLKESHLARIAVLTNYDGKDWVPEAVEYLAFGPEEHRKAFIARLVAALEKIDARGVLIDWQGVDPAYQANITALLRDMGGELHKAGRELWLEVSVGDDLNAFDLSQLAESVDHFVAALHDENGQDDEPGPIASSDWFEGWLQALLGGMDPSQWIVELGAYGYDWGGSPQGAEELSFADAMTRARYSGAEDVEVKEPDLNPSFSYSENGRDHTVWFLDAVTFYNQLRVAQSHGISGVAVSRLGEEDPAIWRVLDAPREGKAGRAALADLSRIASSPSITHFGEGEIVSVETLDQAGGGRALAETPGGMVTAAYKTFPVFPTLFHTGGEIPGRVALTFDDGPDPKWTPRILDILRQYHVHATFFVLGANAEKYPALLRRIVAEGHEIGSHTFTHSNLAVVPERQVVLELNATQRVIEGATGRSTQLFRPPYDADSRPEEISQLRPLQIAQELGYLTVLEQVDPEDWDRPGVEEIVRRVRDQQSEGSIILLHDAGGDRRQTAEALPRILEDLAKRGVEVVSVADMLGTSNEKLMPPVADRDNQAFASVVSGMGFGILRFLRGVMWFSIVSATVLVAARTVVILVLALLHWRKERPAGSHALPLSIIVPAFKEGRVIAATLRSLLKSDYPSAFEIIVIDDGSPDDTVAEARRVAAEDARVRVLEQPNSGKATALENGVKNAVNDIVVFLDADTHFEPDTLRRLVAPLEDGGIGAVAGHPRVGNARTLIARCQDIEYIVAFNLDRRALSLWNAVTVVPGAVSAFRRQALLEAGGFRHDTLAEDTDLTLAIHEAGWRIECAPDAVARTEAPETVSALVKQRFRWALGTMQCIWKHRHQTFSRRNLALGWFSLPGVWLFQIVLVASAPFIDLLFFQSAIMGRWDVVLPYFSVFLISDLLLAFAACRMEPVKWTQAFWVLPMRFIYRPLLSYVIWKAIAAALRGAWVGWGKLDRTGNVVSPATVHPA